MDIKTKYIAKVTAALVIAFLGTMLLVYTASAVTPSVVIDNPDEPYRVEQFTINTPGDLEVRTSGGHITVKASGSNSVRVEMYARQNGRELMPSDTDLSEFDIDIRKSGNTVYASAQRKEDKGWKFWNKNSISISFVVYAPKEMSSRLKTSGGHISLQGMNGNQEVSTSGGHLSFEDMNGTVNARTSGGHIKIASFEGEMKARTSGGHIEVQRSEGSFNLQTSGGHISLKQVGGTVEASTSGGNISAELVNIGQFADMRTSGGSISIEVPGNTGLDLHLKGSMVRSSLENFSGNVERDEIRGSINGGGPQLTARTSGGVVRISSN